MAYKKTDSKILSRPAASTGPPRRKDLRRRKPPGMRIPKVITRSGLKSLLGPDISVSEALDEIDSKEYIASYTGPSTPETTSLLVIEGLGFTVVPGAAKMLKEFSLIGEENVDESIENPKIMDPDLKLLTPDLTSASDKFKDVGDPFYDFDDERPDSVKKEELIQKRKEDKKFIRVARSLSDIVRSGPSKMLDKKVTRKLS
tara:strand:- start:252 stop:854 length:603 start_codon:yes stop_codon:yes gene_type:complete